MTRDPADTTRLREGTEAEDALDLRLARQLTLLAEDDRMPVLVAAAERARPSSRALMSLRLAAALAVLLSVGGGASATVVLLVRRWHQPPAAPVTVPRPEAEPPPPPARAHRLVHRPSPPEQPAAVQAPAPAPEPAPPVPVRHHAPPKLALVADPPPATPEIAQEAELLREVLLGVRPGGDPARALALLDSYAARFPRGALGAEAAAMRAQALLRLGDRPAALAVLDGLPLTTGGGSAQLVVTRGELRSIAGRCRDALTDFDWALDASRLSPADRARALYGRASCRARQGDGVGAEQDRQRYLREFPDGPAAAQLTRNP